MESLLLLRMTCELLEHADEPALETLLFKVSRVEKPYTLKCLFKAPRFNQCFFRKSGLKSPKTWLFWKNAAFTNIFLRKKGV